MTPQNMSEMTVCVILMGFGSIFWAFTVGQFCSIVSTMDLQSVEFRQRMDELNFMMVDLHIEEGLKRRLVQICAS